MLCVLGALLGAVAGNFLSKLSGAATASRVCVSNGNGNNPRTASLFTRGALQKYGSKYHFTMRNATDSTCHGETKSSISLALVSRLMTKWATEHPTWKSVKNLCTGSELCIITGDELCQVPVDWFRSDHIILRQ